MATKTIVIGKQEPTRKLKKIQFECYLNSVPQKGITAMEGTFGKYIEEQQDSYDTIELICLNYVFGKDLMFAYNNNETRSNGLLYVGYWNDGVV